MRRNPPPHRFVDLERVIDPIIGVALTSSDKDGVVEVKLLGGFLGGSGVKKNIIDNTDSPEAN